MEEKVDQETKAMGAAAGQAEDSVKSKILERIQDQMAQDASDPGTGTGTPIYLKAPDDYP